LLWGLVAVSFVAVGKLVVNRYGVIKQRNSASQESKEVAILPEESSQVIKLEKQADSKSDKQERLLEITARLEALQKEQKDLLQEAATLMVSHQVEITPANPQGLGLGSR
jgi:predicted transcriptional regulator